MYEKMLVPLDGSELAEVALPYASELAGRLGADITLLYVMESGEEQYQRMHQMYLQKTADVVKRRAKFHSTGSENRLGKVQSAILRGNPAEGIVQYANKKDIGLIVMATHGRSGIKRWALGSVADKVLRATNLPVALIRAKGAAPIVREQGILKKMLVPLDGSKEGETVLAYIEEIAFKLKVQVVLLQVVELGYFAIAAEGYNYIIYSNRQMESFKGYAQKYLDEVVTRLKSKGVMAEAVVAAGNAAEEIITLADNIHTDLVAMSTHGRSGVGRWVFGSVAEKVLYEGNAPLLLVRVPKAGTK